MNCNDCGKDLDEFNVDYNECVVCGNTICSNCYCNIEGEIYCESCFDRVANGYLEKN